MAAFSSILLALLCVVLVSNGSAEARNIARDHIAPNQTTLTFPALIAFGDSILDTGNNNHILLTTTKCNFPPYGRDFPGGKATGRFGNGKVLSDLIVEGLGIKSTLPAFFDRNLESIDLATGVCFASGGSGLDERTSKLQNVISIWDQLSYFKEYIEKLEEAVGVEKAEATISDSLYLVSSGNNDIAVTYFGHLRNIDLDAYTTLLVSWVSDFVKEMHALGARKFAYLSTLPIGCLPGERTVLGGVRRGCAEAANEAAKLFNYKLEQEFSSLNRDLTGVKIALVDVFNPMLDVIDNSDKFGFDDATNGCCGSGTVEVSYFCNPFSPFTCSNTSNHLFWDAAHPSERAYRLIVPQIIDQISQQLLK